jgi:hypothetical protein
MGDYSKLEAPSANDTWCETQRLLKLLEPVTWTDELTEEFQVWLDCRAKKMEIIGDGKPRRWGKTVAAYLVIKMQVEFCQDKGLIK